MRKGNIRNDIDASPGRQEPLCRIYQYNRSWRPRFRRRILHPDQKPMTQIIMLSINVMVCAIFFGSF